MKAAAMLERHRGKPALIDANLLLLLWCSEFDPELVTSFKRLSSFDAEDVALLQETLTIFSTVKTTTHVLTEVSNLANALPQWRKRDWGNHFTQKIQVISEEWIAASALSSPQAIAFGLTDAALVHLAQAHVIVTADFPLSNLLEFLNLPVLNFNHLRAAEYQ
jgi:hypothetical protein